MQCAAERQNGVLFRGVPHADQLFRSTCGFGTSVPPQVADSSAPSLTDAVAVVIVNVERAQVRASLSLVKTRF